MLSGTTTARPSAISTSSYFPKSNMTMTQTREPITVTEIMGENQFYKALYVKIYYMFKFFSLTYKPQDINVDHMISGITTSTPSRISTSSYFTTTTMTMTQPREQTIETNTKMGEKYLSSVKVIFYQMI